MANTTQISSAPAAPRRTFLLYCPGSEFVVPYLQRQMGEGWDIVTALGDCEAPDRALMLSSTHIYDVSEGLNYDENTPIDAESPWNAYERMFEGYCRTRSLTPVVIRCAEIVGTGMTGLPMRLARGIYRGTLRHVAVPRPRHETRLRKAVEEAERPKALLSVVHAVDVARCADLLTRPGRFAEESETYNLTDNSTTDIDTLIDALAYRINDKHVPSASPFVAGLLNGRAISRAMKRSLTFNPAKILRVTNIEPSQVTNYLRTHLYDESSL